MSHKLTRELTGVFIIKILFLVLIWQLFFTASPAMKSAQEQLFGVQDNGLMAVMKKGVEQ